MVIIYTIIIHDDICLKVYPQNDNLHTYCMCAGIGVAAAATTPSCFRVAAEQLTMSSSNRKMYAIIMYTCMR